MIQNDNYAYMETTICRQWRNENMTFLFKMIIVNGKMKYLHSNL